MKQNSLFMRKLEEPIAKIYQSAFDGFVSFPQPTASSAKKELYSFIILQIAKSNFISTSLFGNRNKKRERLFLRVLFGNLN